MRAGILKPKGTDFRSVSDFNAEWSDRIALLILVGLLVDIGNLFIPENSGWKTPLAIIANVLIMGGVWGELWFLKRARAADDSRVGQAESALADALTRASRAEEALVRLRTERHKLIAGHEVEISAKLRSFNLNPAVGAE